MLLICNHLKKVIERGPIGVALNIWIMVVLLNTLMRLDFHRLLK